MCDTVQCEWLSKNCYFLDFFNALSASYFQQTSSSNVDMTLVCIQDL